MKNIQTRDNVWTGNIFCHNNKEIEQIDGRVGHRIYILRNDYKSRRKPRRPYTRWGKNQTKYY